MFDVSPRDRYLYAEPVGLAVTAMTYGRLQYRPEPSSLTANRRPVVPWSKEAMFTGARLPVVRALIHTRRQPKPKAKPATAHVSANVAAMLRARAARLSEPKERA